MAILTSHIKGDTFLGLPCTLLDNNNVAVDLTGVAIRCYFRYGNPTGERVFKFSIGNGITITNAALGEFYLLKDFLIDWKVGIWYFDIEFTFTDGKVKSSNIETLNIIQDVTYG